MRAARVASKICAGLIAIGVLCVISAESLQKFSPCRTEYRIHNAVQDSLLCRAHPALGLWGIVVVLGSGVALVAVAAWALKIGRERSGRSVP
jgi:drug/metabolite transporter (DMT)-like permease